MLKYFTLVAVTVMLGAMAFGQGGSDPASGDQGSGNGQGGTPQGPFPDAGQLQWNTGQWSPNPWNGGLPNGDGLQLGRATLPKLTVLRRPGSRLPTFLLA
jgi:hypothetical protein